MSLHYNYKPTQQPPVPPPVTISASSTSANISLIMATNLHQSHFQNHNSGVSCVTGSLSTATTVPPNNQTSVRSSSSSNQIFNNNQNINSHLPIEMTLNAHNHPDKFGRQIYINVGNMKMSERKFTVYENNNKLEDPEPIDLYIILEQVFDQGAFGHVRTARIKPDNRSVAVKQVLQDKRYRNRELPLMKQLTHCNIVTLLYYYYHMEEKKNLFLNLVMEYIPSNLNMLIQKNNKVRKNSRHSLPHGDLCSPSAGPVTPLLTIKLCMYQIFRALAYIHSLGICHRDIKPNNLLFNPDTGVLKICDFGSAKHLRKGESHVSYICARFYRAPELLFGATDYNEKIDLWSTGVVFSELLLGQPIFHEHSGIDQLVVIISKLGTPTKDQIRAMNQKYAQYDFPQVYCQPWQSLFPSAPTDALDLISKLFQYDPSDRIPPLRACAHQFFDELREPNKKWFGHDLPPLFDFTDYELSINPTINNRLIPFKNKSNTTNNLAYLQQKQQQMINVCNSRMMAQRNQPSVQASTISVQQAHQLSGPTYPPSNLYPNQNNFPYMSGMGVHYQAMNNHPINSGEMFSQSYHGSSGNNPLGTGPILRSKEEFEEH